MWRWFGLLTLGAALSACRVDYDLLERSHSADGDGRDARHSSGGQGGGSGAVLAGGTAGSGDRLNVGGAGASTSSGGSSYAGSASVGGASGTTFTVDFTVTTGQDEDDRGATPSAPGGTGFSLREALKYSNQEPGTQTISLGGLTASLSADLTNITDSTVLVGDAGSIDGAGAGNSHCLYVEASGVHIEGLHITSCGGSGVFFASTTRGNVLRASRLERCGKPIFIFGEAHLVEEVQIEAAEDDGLAVYGLDHVVRNNRLRDIAFDGIRLGDSASNTQVVGNVVIRAGAGIVANAGATSASIWHNTVVYSRDVGMSAWGAVSTDVRNNVIAFSGDDAMGANDSDLAEFDYNLLYQNAGSPCGSCAVFPGPNTLDSDPRFVGPGADDYSLGPGSTAIDQGVDTGEDRYPAGSGRFLGAAPDLGAFEVE